MKLGEIVKNKRKELNLSLRKLGEKAGVDPGWIAKIEKGELPSPIIAIKLARALSEDEDKFRDWVIKEKLDKRSEFDKKRELIYHSPLSAEEIEKILKKAENRKKK